MMVAAKVGNMVKVHYTGKMQDGVIIDSTVGRDPLQFKLGAGKMIQGFEEAIIGMSPGESKTVTIPPEKGYGLWTKEKQLIVDLKDLPPDVVPEEGKELEIEDDDGRVIRVHVTDISGSSVTLDANHPLSDATLIFDIELLEIL
jgi:peptidylprolyl isomerase